MPPKKLRTIALDQKDRTSKLRQRVRAAGFISGKTVYLEPLSMTHFSAEYIGWLNDSVVCRENRHGVFPYTAADLKKYLQSASSYRDAVHLAIRLQKDHRHVGNVGLVNIAWIDRSAEIAILIGDKSVWGRGIGFEVCALLRDYCFERLNMHRIWMGVTSTNKAMLKIAKKLGMAKEGYFKEALFKEGRYLDIVQWSVLNPKN